MKKSVFMNYLNTSICALVGMPFPPSLRILALATQQPICKTYLFLLYLQ